METRRYVERQNILDSIKKNAPYLNPALKQIADYIVENPERCTTMAINDLATACGVAASTVTRFVKEIGLKSYQELKITIAQALTSAHQSGARPDEKRVYEAITRADPVATIIEKVAFREAEALTESKCLLNVGQVERAVAVIAKANSLVFFCQGSSGIAAEEAAWRFMQAGKKCLLFRDQGGQQAAATLLSPDDAAIAISYSGRTEPVVEALRAARDRGAHTIAITSFEDSPLVKHADIVLFTPAASPARDLAREGSDGGPAGARRREDLAGRAGAEGRALPQREAPRRAPTWAFGTLTAQLFVVESLYASLMAGQGDALVSFIEEACASGERVGIGVPSAAGLLRRSVEAVMGA